MVEDKIYVDPLPKVADFEFDSRVACVFPDMVKRSIPGYENILQLIGVVAKHYVQENSHVYDLGTSLGASLASMMLRISDPSIRFIGMDNSESMVQCAQKVLNPFYSTHQLEIVQQDISQAELMNASVVVMNFTLQFIAIEKRQKIIQKIFQAMRPGGVLLMSEKLSFTSATQKDFQLIHEGFKRDQGYSELEISQKREALENVMKLNSEQEHLSRLQMAGFARVTRIFQYLQFASFIAIKDE